MKNIVYLISHLNLKGNMSTAVTKKSPKRRNNARAQHKTTREPNTKPSTAHDDAVAMSAGDVQAPESSQQTCAANLEAVVEPSTPLKKKGTVSPVVVSQLTVATEEVENEEPVAEKKNNKRKQNQGLRDRKSVV